jgi:hypothetical protein
MPEGQPSNEPGWVFKPGDSPSQSEQPVAVSSEPEQLVAATPEPLQPEAPIETAQELPAEPEADYDPNLAHVEWTASEYIAAPKSGGWFGLLAISSVILAVVVFILTRDILSTAVIGILGIIVGIFAARQPHTLTYSVDNQGLHIGEKFYPYETFKSFSVAKEQAISYISLSPLRRFMPPLTVHYSPDDEGRITQTLAEYLPYEDHKPDVVDSITRRIRF